MTSDADDTFAAPIEPTLTITLLPETPMSSVIVPLQSTTISSTTVSSCEVVHSGGNRLCAEAVFDRLTESAVIDAASKALNFILCEFVLGLFMDAGTDSNIITLKYTLWLR